MSAVIPNLFKGVAVVIDNGIGNEDAIDQILENIAKSGGHTIQLRNIPDEKFDLEHFSNVAFFVMDWNLYSDDDGNPWPAGVTMPSAVKTDMVTRNIEFLKRLSKNRHAPVFIFTNENPEEVQEEIAKNQELARSEDESHILVKSKADVRDRVYEVLESWASETPSVLTLKTWERNFVKAANDLFIDLHNKTPFWPVIFWQTFDADSVPPAAEIIRLLNRLVESRMNIPALDLKPFEESLKEKQRANHEAYKESVYKVLEGERFLRDDKLDPSIFAPGDLFLLNQDGVESYYMNLRPECDCIRGDDNHELYLLKVREDNARIDPVYGTVTGEKDNEAIVFAMMDGKTFSIKFKDTKAKKLKTLRGHRVGRLLPPFITRVQQRYSNYLQRPGLPRTPVSLCENL
ncbi:hypothetical protein [Azospirillum aestuarii]|uniref:hypothetical protein n=1 Tax=Azospirillum aestuarii TaxID=2802052 RepID=UPI004054CF4C